MHTSIFMFFFFFFFQAEDGIRDAQESRGLGDVYKRQLMPSTSEKQVDRDTGLMPDVHQSKFMNYNHSATVDFTFENGAGGDNFPMVPGRIQVPNPYFNFRKAIANISSWTGDANGDRNAGERQFRYKNDTWLLPSVVTAATSVGSADKAPKLYVAGL
eukprot:TRINITY_DN8402_c0_g1_i2.p1 TRINITY_DN8402_c0_g1~~TRINITY_DN8402_c0_g1_i2.p1  ORF type:complete len:158 (-),score=42.48 TRINITY_DN8402_c0_g1_i2:278-751(-)